MLKNAPAFSSFSVDDLPRAKAFYGQTLGLEVTETKMPGDTAILGLRLAGGGRVLVYPKPNHAPASFTVLNFPVESVERMVDALVERGVRMEIYREGPVRTDEKGISARQRSDHRLVQGPVRQHPLDRRGSSDDLTGAAGSRAVSTRRALSTPR